MNNHFSIGKLHNSFGNLLFICFRNFGKTFDENWMMKILDEKIYVLISKDDRCYRRGDSQFDFRVHTCLHFSQCLTCKVGRLMNVVHPIG